MLRDTWFKLVTDRCAVVIRFIFSVTPGTEPAAELVTENIEYNDLLFLPVDKGTRKGYNPGHNPGGVSNLLERVQAFMRWTTKSCQGVKFVFKSDDDCYVAIDKLQQRIEANEFQEKRLYFGHFLGGMSAKNDKGVPDADNYMKLDKFPKYVCLTPLSQTRALPTKDQLEYTDGCGSILSSRSTDACSSDDAIASKGTLGRGTCFPPTSRTMLAIRGFR